LTSISNVVAFIPLLFLGVIVIASFATTVTKTSKNKNKAKQYTTSSKATYPQKYQQQYNTTQINSQMEIDIRLPYRRFKQIYPNNNITYDEYKKMQNQSSFKHAISSQKNHRMVR